MQRDARANPSCFVLFAPKMPMAFYGVAFCANSPAEFRIIAVEASREVDAGEQKNPPLAKRAKNSKPKNWNDLIARYPVLLFSIFDTVRMCLPSLTSTVPTAVTWADDVQTCLWKALLTSLSAR